MSIDSQNLAKTSQILGIDFGIAKVGLAMADEETKMAFAHKTLENNKDLIQNLGKIIAQEEVKKIVIGVPKYKKGETIEKEAIRMGSDLKEKFEVEIFYQDEMFTTKMAQANLIEKGMKNLGKLDDKEAARIILQDWLDRN